MRASLLLVSLFLCGATAVAQKKTARKPEKKHRDDSYIKLQQAEYKTCDSLNNLFDSNPCAILSLLQDSTYLYYKMHFLCFHELINRIKTKSGKHPNMSYGYNYGKEYSNYSFGKSLYKHDIIIWSRFFNCSDTINLKARKYGNFSQQEYHIIKQYNETIKVEKNYPGHIDTTIFD